MLRTFTRYLSKLSSLLSIENQSIILLLCTLKKANLSSALFFSTSRKNKQINMLHVTTEVGKPGRTGYFFYTVWEFLKNISATCFRDILEFAFIFFSLLTVAEHPQEVFIFNQSRDHRLCLNIQNHLPIFKMIEY